MMLLLIWQTEAHITMKISGVVSPFYSYTVEQTTGHAQSDAMTGVVTVRIYLITHQHTASKPTTAPKCNS